MKAPIEVENKLKDRIGNNPEMDVDCETFRELPPKVIIKNEREDSEALSELHLNSCSGIKNEVHWIKCEMSNTEEFGLGTGNQSAMGTDSETFQVRELKKEWDIKEEIDENADAILPPDRIKSEQSNIDWNESDFIKKNILEMKVENESESRIDLDIKVNDLTQELIIKDENGTNWQMLKHPEGTDLGKLFTCIHCDATFKSERTVDDHILRKHPDFSKSITSKIYECANCNYKTTIKYNLKRHMPTHPDSGSKYKLKTCIHCNAAFKNKISLEDHIVRKHPDFISSVASKLYQCTKCVYKTVLKGCLYRHMLKHPETASLYKLSICTHCNAEFRSKQTLDDHVVRKHPEFTTSVNRKLYECTKCTYKTTIKKTFEIHRSTHPESGSNFKLNTCNHCYATFKRKSSLNDHIVKKHPDFITSIARIYECTECAYKTVLKNNLDRHMSTHSVTDLKLNMCIHCNTKYKRKASLEEHLIRKHPDFVTTVVKKIYECTECTYKTTFKYEFNKHLSMHPQISSSYKLRTCIHCNATFKNKISLDEHVIKKHPNFITSVTRKLYECTNCDYKTTIKNTLQRHMLIHPETDSKYKFKTCIHCSAAFKSKISLENHIMRKHPDFISSITSKLYQCTKCVYKTVIKDYFYRHMSKHPETAGLYKLSICTHCNAEFRNKQTLDDHIVRKHPDFITSVNRKLYECTKCPFKTTTKKTFGIHMSTHPESDSNFKLNMCSHCYATFKRKALLNDHIIKKHPNFTMTVAKIYECTECAYKTAIKKYLDRHMSTHSEVVSSDKLNTCIHCNTKYKRKSSLEEHLIRKHPDSAPMVAKKIYECTECTYKTTFKYEFNKHLSVHPQTRSSYKLRTCIHCNATFKNKISLDEHVIRKHPKFITSVTRKLYECAKCAYKTTYKNNFEKHMSTHLGTT